MGRDASSFRQLHAAQPPTPGAQPGADSVVSDFSSLPPVGLIRNPRSHRNKGHPEPRHDQPEVILAEPTTRQELEDALREFARRGIGLLAVSGGDGTIRDVLTRGAPIFGQDWPAVIVLPQGKTNALAIDLGVSKEWTLEDALASVREGRIVTRRPLLVEQLDGEQRDRYGFIFGAGAFNAAIDAGQVAHRHGAFQGFAVGMTAVFGILQAIFGIGNTPWRKLSGMRLTDKASGQELAHSGVCPTTQRFMTGFTTLRTFPLGLRPFDGLKEKGTIRYFVLDAPLRRVAVLFPAAALGWQNPVLDKLGMHRGAGEEFLIELDDPYILDGERFPTGTYRVSPGAPLRFVTP